MIVLLKTNNLRLCLNHEYLKSVLQNKNYSDTILFGFIDYIVFNNVNIGIIPTE